MLFSKKNPVAEQQGDVRGEEKSSAISRFVSDLIDEEYETGKAHIRADCFLDLTTNKNEDGSVYYNLLNVDMNRVEKVSSVHLPRRISSFRNVFATLPGEICVSKFFHSRRGESIDRAAAVSLPFKLDTCLYDAVAIEGQGEYTYSFVTAIPDTAVSALDIIFGELFQEGGSVIRLMDRVLPLSQYVAEKCDLSAVTFCLEHRRDEICIWNLALMNGKLIPVNSMTFRLSLLDTEENLKKNILLLEHELVRKMKFAPPEKAVVITDGSPVLFDTTQEIFASAIRETVTRSKSAGFANLQDSTEVIIATDGVLRGMSIIEQKLSRKPGA